MSPLACNTATTVPGTVPDLAASAASLIHDKHTRSSSTSASPAHQTSASAACQQLHRCLPPLHQRAPGRPRVTSRAFTPPALERAAGRPQHAQRFQTIWQQHLLSAHPGHAGRPQPRPQHLRLAAMTEVAQQDAAAAAAAAPDAAAASPAGGGKDLHSSHGLVLPLARIKKAMKEQMGREKSDVKTISADANWVMGRAAELFLQQLAVRAHAVMARDDKRKAHTLDYKDLAAAVQSWDALDFLNEVVPQKVSAARILAEIQQQQQQQEVEQ